jgi:hypothetical protein
MSKSDNQKMRYIKAIQKELSGQRTGSSRDKEVIKGR